ncbi:hypothetical protein GCM10009809_15640 [Isoptericola hypogeus]|uniref:Membrane protein DUF2157 n=1 Tax=Isoptericola hypogeus TaxID=300179 RepID=A0ABP4VCD7_9MICO
MTGGRSDETTFVTPVLVRDYRRLLRLFPLAYRREHEAEMLGHLLDDAAPGQSRPTRAERWDLLRAAAREWLLAPLGSTPTQRRAGTSWLLVLLPLLLGVAALAGLWVGVSAFHATGSLRDAVVTSPFGPSWVLWGIGTILLVLGALKTARGLLAVSAAVGWFTVVALIASDEVLAVYTGVGWAVGQTAFAVVVAERTRWGRPVRQPFWRRLVVLVTVGAVAMPLTTAAQNLLDGSLVGGPLTLGFMIGADTLRVSLGLLLVGLLFSQRARQSVPVLAGVAAAVVIGRTGIFGSRTAPFYGVDLADLLVLLAVSIVVTVGLRWLVNRVDELAEARRGLAEASSPAVGGPTTT